MKKLSVFFMLILALTAGCASEKKKPSADSLLAEKAYDHIIAVKEAYEKKNRAFIEQQAPELSAIILRELSFEKAELLFHERLVRITDSSVTVNLNWRGFWWTGDTSIPENPNRRGSWLTGYENKLEDRGTADFIINRETMTLSRIEGDNPFRVPKVKKQQ